MDACQWRQRQIGATRFFRRSLLASFPSLSDQSIPTIFQLLFLFLFYAKFLFFLSFNFLFYFLNTVIYLAAPDLGYGKWDL